MKDAGVHNRGMDLRWKNWLYSVDERNGCRLARSTIMFDYRPFFD